MSVEKYQHAPRNQHQRVLFRCPSCQKLYQTDRQDLGTEEPHFDCQSCGTEFVLDLSQPDGQIQARAVTQPDFSQLNQMELVEEKPELKKCPKCHAANPRSRSECFRCGIIFSKFEVIASESSSCATPSLVKSWQGVLADYDNVDKHREFISQCESRQALPFAMQKYEDVKAVQPFDEISTLFLNELKQNLSRSQWWKTLRTWSETVDWALVAKRAPIVIGGTSILLGAMSHSLSYFIGFGVSLIFLTSGLIVLFKGRVTLRDLWD